MTAPVSEKKYLFAQGIFTFLCLFILSYLVVTIITCVLGGGFISFTDNNKVLDAICSIFPQKSYMTLIHGIEKGNGMLEFKGYLIYLLIWIVGLWLLGSCITNEFFLTDKINIKVALF